MRKSSITCYHGTTLEFAQAIVASQKFRESEWEGDWLGKGIYFFQDAKLRALEWAEHRCKSAGGEPAVLECEIDPGICFDLLDIRWWPLLEKVYEQLQAFHESVGFEMVQQRGIQLISADGSPIESNHGKHLQKDKNTVDCMVIDGACTAIATAVRGSPNKAVQTVRSAFIQGVELFVGSHFFKRSHVQLAVRDHSVIKSIKILDAVELKSFYDASTS